LPTGAGRGSIEQEGVALLPPFVFIMSFPGNVMPAPNLNILSIQSRVAYGHHAAFSSEVAAGSREENAEG